MQIDTWPWFHTCWGHMVIIGPQGCKRVKFYIFRLSYKLTSHDLWPSFVTFDLMNMWRFPHYINKPSLLQIWFQLFHIIFPEIVQYIPMIYSVQNPYIQRIEWPIDFLIRSHTHTHTHKYKCHTACVVFRWLWSVYWHYHFAKYHKLTVHRIQPKLATF